MLIIVDWAVPFKCPGELKFMVSGVKMVIISVKGDTVHVVEDTSVIYHN